MFRNPFRFGKEVPSPEEEKPDTPEKQENLPAVISKEAESKPLIGVEVEVPARYSGEQESAEKEKVVIEELRNLKKDFPNLEIIEKEKEKPTKECLPSTARMEDVSESELIWLTREAVEERLEVLMHTHPQFNVKPSIVVKEFKEGASRELNVRRGISSQEVVKNFENAGFSFVENEDGQVVMLVDAVIPARQNTNGRHENIYMGSLRSPGVIHEGAAVLPQDRRKIGFRPAKGESTHAIAIPINKLIEIHQRPAGIETMYLLRDQRIWGSYLGDLNQKLNHSGKTAAHNAFKYFEFMRQDPEFGGEIERLISSSSFHGGTEVLRDKKMALLDLLSKLGLKVHITNGGYFPYEPEINLSDRLEEDEQIGRDSLKRFSDRAYEEKTGFAVGLMLEEMLMVLEELHVKYHEKSR